MEKKLDKDVEILRNKNDSQLSVTEQLISLVESKPFDWLIDWNKENAAVDQIIRQKH